MLLNRSSVDPIDSAEVQFFLSTSTESLYAFVAIATILCYDTITNLDKEVKYFWSSPRKISSIVYFLNRYIGIFGTFTTTTLGLYHTNSQLCKFSAWGEDIGDWMPIVLIDYILLMRVLALWHDAKKLALCLKALLAAESAFMLGIVIKATIVGNSFVGGAEGFTFCLDNGIPPLYETLYWIIPLVFELILLILSLYKAAKFWQNSAGFNGVSLVRVLILDQVLYFVAIMICSVAHIILQWVDMTESSNVASNIVQDLLTSVSFPCIVGCRLLVHLNEAAERGVNGGTSYRVRSRSVSEIQFA